MSTPSYLVTSPSRSDLERVLSLLGTADPRVIARVDDPLRAELGLDAASDAAVLDALGEHPTLIQRPIVIIEDRAVIARPPERLFEILGPAEKR